MGILSKVGKFLFGWLVPDAPEPEIQGAELTKAATDAYIPKIYGKVKKHKGTIIFKATNDVNNDEIANELLHIVIVWSEAVQSIDKVYVDDIDIASNSELFVVNGNRYAHARNFPNGMANYNDDLLTDAGWRATDTCAGKACTYIRLQFANGENTLRGEPNFTADLTGTTHSNPATALKDYLTADKYGKDLDDSFLDLPSFAAAEVICNTQVEEVVSSGNFRSLFTINAAIDTGQTVFDNVNSILKSMRALLPISDGKLKLIIEKDDPAVSVPILEKDIIELGNITNSSKRNRYNRVSVTYRDEDANGTRQEAVYPAKNSQTETDWLAEDSGFLLDTSVNLETCNNYYEALAFAKSYAEVSREQLSTTVTLELWATIYEVGDIVEVTHSIPGWTGKAFRIISIEESDYQVELSLREHQPYIYDFENTGLKPSYPDTSSELRRPATPTSAAKTDFYTLQKQVEISWAGTTTRYDIELRDSLGDSVLTQQVSRKKIELRNLELGQYTIIIRAVNSVGMRSLSLAYQFDIDQESQGFIWQIYADDDIGTNASLTDASKAFIGLAFFREVETPDLTDLTVYTVWLPNTASRWIYDTGAPDPSTGSVGDNYLDTATNDVYTKSPTGWVLVANFGSGDGDGFFSGTANPLPSFGADGNTFLNLTTYELFKKSAGTWVSQGIIKGADGQDGQDGQSATVTRSGNIVTITAANGSVQVFDGNDGNDGNDAPIPTFTTNPDGSVTINPNTGAASLTIPAGTDGSTPVLNVDYFVAGGNYVSNIFTNATSRPATPTGGTFNGSSETFPAGWTDNPTDYTPPSKRWVSTRQYERNPVNGAWSAVGAWSTPALQGEKGDTGDTGITASVLTPSGRQWSIDADGNFSPSQTASLPFTVIFYKNGTQVASGTVNVAVTTAGNLTSGTQSLGAGVAFSISGTNLRARTYSMTYQDVTASASFAVVQDGANGASVTVTNTSTDANGNTVVTFSDGSSVTVNKGEDGGARGVQPIYANDTVGNGRDLNIGSREFVNFYEWIGSPLVDGETLPNGLTYVRFRGEAGDEGIANGVVPIYATNAAGSSASFTQGSREYVNFYEWTVAKPTTVPSGLTYLKIVGPTGPQGPQGPAGPQGPIGPSSQDLYDQEKNTASSSTNVGGWVTLLTMNPAQGVGTFNQTFTVSLAGSLLSNALEPQPITSYFEINFLSGASVVGSGTATSSTSENPFINYVRTPADYSNSSGASYSIRARMIQVGSGTVGSGGWTYNASWVLKRN